MSQILKHKQVYTTDTCTKTDGICIVVEKKRVYKSGSTGIVVFFNNNQWASFMCPLILKTHLWAPDKASDWD